MAPPSEITPMITPTSGLKYPANRDALDKGVYRWLKDRNDDDGAEGLWRVHDKIYDFTDFIRRHPGGAEWFHLTKGTDITEAFECHHYSPLPSQMLNKFFVRSAVTPRSSPYTFEPHGFYSKLKERVNVILNKPSDHGPAVPSKIIIDSMAFAIFAFAMLSVYFQSAILALLSGLALGMTTTIAHNFFHMADNFRRYYFDLSCMSSTYWRISHVLSHHLFPNTISDLELSLAEPFLNFLPSKDKSTIHRYLTCLISPIFYSIMFPLEILRRVIMEGVAPTDLLPFTIPLAMILCSPQGQMLNTLYLWAIVVMSGSFYFSLVGINAAHHHPYIFHDGDAVRENRDWGLSQLDAVRDRPSVSGAEGSLTPKNDGTMRVVIDDSRSHSVWTLFKVLTNFGHHTLHHMFPTVDHAHLPRLYPALAETLNEFRVPFRTSSFSDMVIGQFMQLVRTEPNPEPPITLPSRPPMKED